jgi:hypothetical protein
VASLLVMSSSFGVLVSIVDKPPDTFPFERTKKAATPTGLDVSPEAAALLSAHRWTFSASQRYDGRFMEYLIQASCQIGPETNKHYNQCVMWIIAFPNGPLTPTV